jgi:hypothetical protein
MMPSSPNEAIPVKLPIPPAAPYLPTDPVAARALAALSDEAAPSSLDVHIRWTVESGNIVRTGEKIAHLFYTFHGMPPPPPIRANNGNAIIRARRRRSGGLPTHKLGATNASGEVGGGAGFNVCVEKKREIFCLYFRKLLQTYLCRYVLI